MKEKLIRQIQAQINGKLSKCDKLYQKSFGKYEFNSHIGEFLIEFNEKTPDVGIYYGLKFEKIDGDLNVDEIEKIFEPLRNSLAYLLGKTIYVTDNNDEGYYWAFWLRNDNATINEIIAEMNFILYFFNQLIQFSNMKICKK